MTDKPRTPPKGRLFSAEDGSASAAGKRSGEVRRQRVTLREELIALLTEDIRDKNSGKKMKMQKAISAAIVRQALQGSTKAFEIIRDTIGEKPAENLVVAAADFSALDEAFAAMKNNDPR